MKGTYILVMELEKDSSIIIGKKGIMIFEKGWYCYIGSALNGLEQRIKRHMRSEKKTHWHIDYFLKKVVVKDIFIKESMEKQECKVAKDFSKRFTEISHFGCSDCACQSHLFYEKNGEFLDLIKDLGFISFSI